MSGKSELQEYAEVLVVAVALALFLILFVVQTFVVEGESMEPTLQDGERLLVDKMTYRFREPMRGDVVVFKYPANEKRKFIKRVIGLPGDRIAIHDNHVWLNGEPLVETYIHKPVMGPYGRPFPPLTVEEGTLFVLGDNRPNSDDSRYSDVGLVPRENVIGLARVVYWPVGELAILRPPVIFAEQSLPESQSSPADESSAEGSSAEGSGAEGSGAEGSG